MNSLQSLINHIFKITEAYQLLEMSKDGALVSLQNLASHLLRAFQNLDKYGEGYEQNAVKEIEKKFIININKNLKELVWNKPKVLEELGYYWDDSINQALMSYKSRYSNNFMLYPFTSMYAKNLEQKIIEDRVEFKDLGLEIDENSFKRVQFKFNFELAKKSNSQLVIIVL